MRLLKIIRVKNDFSCEERLENLSYVMNNEVFDMVLKMCFKVMSEMPLRVFNWL